MAAAGKAAAVAAAKPAAGLGVVLTIQISAGRAGVPAAPARDVGAVAAVPRTEAATVAGQLGALGLVQQTGVDFKPYHMDRETLLKYRRYTKKLTKNDRKRLKKLVCGRFKNVIDYMLEHDCKLEQEAID